MISHFMQSYSIFYHTVSVRSQYYAGRVSYMQMPVEFILFSQNDIHLDFSVNGPWVSHYLIIREGLLKKATTLYVSVRECV